MDALGKPPKEPIRSTLPKPQNPKYLMHGISIGIMLVFGSGILWVIGGSLDCSDPKQVNQVNCKNLVNITNYMPIGLVGGIALVGITMIWYWDSNNTNDKPKTDQVK